MEQGGWLEKFSFIFTSPVPATSPISPGNADLLNYIIFLNNIPDDINYELINTKDTQT